VARLYPQAPCSYFVAYYNSQRYGGSIRPRLHTGSLLSESESYVTTDGQSAGLSWTKVTIWGWRPDLYYCLTVARLLIWGVLSDESTGLSFTIVAGPRQHSHSRVRVPLHSWSYFSVSTSLLPFSSPHTTRRATVEVFDPASTRDLFCLVWSDLPSYLRENRIEITAFKGFITVFLSFKKLLPLTWICPKSVAAERDSQAVA
jgi:hypothetical protein